MAVPLDPHVATWLGRALMPAATGRLSAFEALLSGGPAIRVRVPDCKGGAALVTLFDGLEAACHAYRLAGAAWLLERLDILAFAADPSAEASARRMVNAFWGWDPEARWEMARRHDRLPLVWTCRFAPDGAAPAGSARDLVFGLAARAGEPPLEPASLREPPPLVLPRADRAAARYFLARFTGQPDFGPGQWEAVSRILAGRHALLVGPGPGADPVCRLLASLLPGLSLRVVWTQGGSPEPDLEAIRDPAVRSLAVPVWRLQDQRFLQRLRHALRAVPGGLALVVVAGAERTSIWCADFAPTYTRLPAAIQEVATRPGVPVLALADTTDARVAMDVQEAFRTPPVNPEAVAEPPSPALAFPPELIASEPDSDTLAPVRAKFPAWRLEADFACRELESLATAIETGGFSTVPVRRIVSLDADAGRADRFRSDLGRLHALGFISGFGESAGEFVVKHPIVTSWSVRPYLATIAERALGWTASLEPGELAALGPVDLCECLVQQILGRSAHDARRTALFYELRICPFLHQAAPIAVPKRPQPEDDREFFLEAMLYRLAQLDVVREYFLNLEGAEDPGGGTWKVAFRKPDREVIEEILNRRRRESLRAPGSAPAPLVGRPPASYGEVSGALERLIRTEYDAILPARVAALRCKPDLPDQPVPAGPKSDLGEVPETSRGSDCQPQLEAAFGRELAGFDPVPIVAAFATRLELGILRDRAAERVRSNPEDLAARALLWLANWELGAAREASLALSRALDAVPAAGSAAATEALLALCPPQLRAIELGMRREALAALLGPRRVRELLHDACAAAGREHDADAELLAELLPLSALWQSAQADLEPLAPLLSKLESGYGPLGVESRT